MSQNNKTVTSCWLTIGKLTNQKQQTINAIQRCVILINIGCNSSWGLPSLYKSFNVTQWFNNQLNSKHFALNVASPGNVHTQVLFCGSYLTRGAIKIIIIYNTTENISLRYFTLTIKLDSVRAVFTYTVYACCCNMQ